MFCPDHTGSPGGKVRRVENICGRGGERELSPSCLGTNVSCRGLAVSLFRELLPQGELPWLWRDTGYLEPLLWEHGRGPKVKVFEWRPSCVCRQLPLASKLVVQSSFKDKVAAEMA